MPDSDRFAAYPDTVRHGTAHPDLVYERVAGWHAVRGEGDEEAAATLRDADDRPIVVREGEPPDEASARPVYAPAGGGPPAVPTEVVFVRFADGTDATARQQDLEDIGYEIVDVPVYAPNAAWIRAASGEPADALAHIERLETLAGVENVEPNFLVEAQRREGP